MVAHTLACKALAMDLMKVKFKILISCTKFLVGFFLFLLYFFFQFFFFLLMIYLANALGEQFLCFFPILAISHF